MGKKWYNGTESVLTGRRPGMNFQQLSNLQYWTSLFSSPWTIVTNLIDQPGNGRQTNHIGQNLT